MNNVTDAELREQAARKLRKRFMMKAYMIFAVCIALTVLQWSLIMLSSKVSVFLITHVELCLVSFFVALILMTVFVFIETVRTVAPLNWFLAFIILESLIWGLSRILVVTCYEVVGISLAFVIIPLILFIILGSFIRHDFTLDVIILFVMAFICLVGAVYFVTLHVVGEAFFAYAVFTIMVYVVVCIFVMYHTQTINGNHYAEMRLTDYLLAALILYIDFLILYMVTTYAVKLVWNRTTKKGCNKYARYVDIANYNRLPFKYSTTPAAVGVRDGATSGDSSGSRRRPEHE